MSKLNGDPGIQTRVEVRGRERLIVVAGKITIDSSPALRALVLQHLDSADCDRLILDLFEVLYVDTSCLAVLLEILKAARLGNKTIHLSGLRDRPRYLLEATRILRLFPEIEHNSRQSQTTGGNSQ